jgi:hypothetical protein
MQGRVERWYNPQAIRKELKRHGLRFPKYLNLSARGSCVKHEFKSAASAVVMDRSEYHALEASAIYIGIDEAHGANRPKKGKRDIHKMYPEIE